MSSQLIEQKYSSGGCVPTAARIVAAVRGGRPRRTIASSDTCLSCSGLWHVSVRSQGAWSSERPSSRTKARIAASASVAAGAAAFVRRPGGGAGAGVGAGGFTATAGAAAFAGAFRSGSARGAGAGAGVDSALVCWGIHAADVGVAPGSAAVPLDAARLTAFLAAFEPRDRPTFVLPAFRV